MYPGIYIKLDYLLSVACGQDPEMLHIAGVEPSFREAAAVVLDGIGEENEAEQKQRPESQLGKAKIQCTVWMTLKVSTAKIHHKQPTRAVLVQVQCDNVQP